MKKQICSKPGCDIELTIGEITEYPKGVCDFCAHDN